jgi:hypothetical protein
MSSTSSSDDEAQDVRRPRVFKERINIEHEIYPAECTSRFRLSTVDVDNLVNVLRESLHHPTKRNCALSEKQQVCVALRFLATGAPYSVIADAHGVSKATVSRCVTSVVDGVNTLMFHDLVAFPIEPEELRSIAVKFYREGGIPSVIGCVDGTHIAISRPTANEKAFVNRHGYHSINAMVVCGPDMYFYYASARWPGSVSDARVWRNSELVNRLENGWRPLDRSILIGDSGYPNSEFLITPLARAVSNQEIMYNASHRRTRHFVECSIGLLKQRFQCLLDKPLQMKPEKAARVINCCIALHNFIIKNRGAAELQELDFAVDVAYQDEGNDDGNVQRRREIINNL